MMNNIETMKQALEALEIVNREMLTLRDELAERGGRPTQGYHQLLWDSSHKVYTDTAIPTAEALRQAIKQAQQAEPVVGVFDYKEHAEGLQRDYDLLLAEYNDLKAQQAEPVAFASHGVVNWIADKQFQHEADLYTSPPQRQPWVGLTGDEVNEFAAGCHLGNSVQGAIRKAEAKIKEKNT